MTLPTVSSPDFALGQNDPAFLPPSVRAVRHVISFLQWRFSMLPMGTYHFEPTELDSVDAGSTEVLISADTPVNARKANFRPAITVMRSQLQFQGVGIGDVVDHRWGSGGKSRMDLLPTTLVINVLSRVSVVAERLAWFVQDQIFGLRELIVEREPCILYLGQRTQMAPPTPAGALVDSAEGEDWINVALYLPAYLQHVVHTEPLNVPVVNAITAVLRDKATRGAP